MMVKGLFVAVVVCAAVLSAIALVSNANELARGFGDSIAWRDLAAGQLEAEQTGKPIFIIIHKTWCGACKALKPALAQYDEYLELSRYFVMVNLEDDEEPADGMYAPDGGYIPRILFADPSGTVVDELYNKFGNQKYKYYYHDGPGVAAAMRRALEHFDVSYE
eukprot:m.13815 g.13815  ORF g.13815 m.13815 type:complete len:163 (+) comp4200_c0_seq3:74-562(+)